MSADYFRTLGVAVLEGREFTAADHADSPLVAIVNRTLAERLWPGRPAIGQILTFPLSGGDRTVIGVVDDVRYRALAEPTRPLAYLPLAQRFFPRAFVHARSPADPGVTLQHVRRVLADLDPGMPLSGAGTLRDRVDEALARWRAPALLAGLLALVTLVLTMGGLYAVLTMAVGQRTRELAIRVALGASEVSLRWMVLAQGLRRRAAERVSRGQDGQPLRTRRRPRGAVWSPPTVCEPRVRKATRSPGSGRLEIVPTSTPAAG